MSKLTTDQQDIMSHLREVPETALNCYNLFCQPNNRWDVDEMQVRNCLREDACPEAAAKVMAAMKSSEA